MGLSTVVRRAPEAIRRRIDPMVKGLVQGDWQDLAVRELGQRTFVLNFQGAKAAMDVELPSCDMESAWRILWALYGDYGLKPEDIEMAGDGLAGDFAHGGGPPTRPRIRTATSWFTKQRACCTI